MVKIQVDDLGKAIMLNNKALGTTGVGEAGGFLVQVIDYDGTVLKKARLDEGSTFTLPSAPTHEGLVFDGWSSPVTITNNTITVTNSDITIGPMFHTSSGLSEFDITLTSVTGLNVTLNMDGTKNWGDGTSDTSTTHTYLSVGNYTITCNGSTMTTSSNSGLFGQSSSAVNYYVKDLRLGSSITSISINAFLNCYSLASITIPINVTSIGNQVFENCRSLTSITIPSNVTSIGSRVFYYCYSLTSITIPEGVTSIGGLAFAVCNSLTSITIPEGVTSIDSSIFTNCYSLTNITIPEGVTSIGVNTFFNCYSLTNITIPEGVTSIGDYTFYNCYSLTNVTIPSSVTSIGTYAFYYCYSLTNITIPEGVTSIGNQAFNNCLSLKSITIPARVTTINSSVFYSCYCMLEYDFSNHTSVPVLNNVNAFTYINQICKIKVPSALESQWKATSNWSIYADYIVGV